MTNAARLDRKTGLLVLCGKQSDGRYICRGELARVAVLESGKRVLCMLDGWIHKARGHWKVSEHSARRLAGAQSAVARGELAAESLAARSRPRFRRPKETSRRFEGDPMATAYGLRDDNYVVHPGPAGILADCPRCSSTNVLLADALRVAAS